MINQFPCECNHLEKEHRKVSTGRTSCHTCSLPIYKLSKDDWNKLKAKLNWYWVHPYKRDNLRYLEQLSEH